MDNLILDVRHLSHRFKLTRKLAVQALDDLSCQGSLALGNPRWRGA